MKTKIAILFSLALTLTVQSCNNNIGNTNVLSVSIEPQKYFLEQLVGDKYTVNSLIPAGANPESFDPTPSQLIAISKSKAYFQLGLLGVEKTLVSKIKDNNPNVIFVDCSTNIVALTHEHDHNCNHSTEHDGQDPHIWSSPATARAIADQMYQSLLEMDNDNEVFYTKNYNALIVKINNTDSIIKNYLNRASSRSFIIYHPALSYFAQEYGLNQYSIEHEGKMPSPMQLKKLIDTAKIENIQIVFIQQEYDTKNAEMVAQAINGKTVSINLMAYDWSYEMIKIAKAIANE